MFVKSSSVLLIITVLLDTVVCRQSYDDAKAIDYASNHKLFGVSIVQYQTRFVYSSVSLLAIQLENSYQ